MRTLSLAATAAAAAVLASCSTSPPVPAEVYGQQQLQSLLAGKVAGETTSCMPARLSSAPAIIAPNAIAFRVNSGSVYVSNTAGMGCESLAGTQDTLVTRSMGAGLCSGEIVEVRNLQTGTTVGSCTLGEFVRYSSR